ncbi:recombinase family protein [Thermoflexibacter ruber]|uniref:Recombinase n=1 Tax=Thermoflexibacter ruber TaxID=1003 RepID=A0A1I2K185_9BACT|nr:recombinase family protein [Thermoflexibacter ruber]SFF58967.1 Recombinase [Thermoflexibacter ruber]
MKKEKDCILLGTTKRQKELIKAKAKQENKTVLQFVLDRCLQDNQMDLLGGVVAPSKPKKQSKSTKEMIVDLKNKGLNSSEIANFLNGSNVTTKNGKAFTSENVRKILASAGKQSTNINNLEQ